MTENSKIARRFFKLALENEKFALTLAELITRIGWEEVTLMSYLDLQHVTFCPNTYRRCAHRPCVKLRTWRFNNAKQVELEKEYWTPLGLVFPERTRE
jgi:hypothetical protein